MRAEAPVHYLHDAAMGIEVILCRDSSLSYPLHTHASTFTAGLVLSGEIRFASGRACRALGPGRVFLVPPHTPHRIEPDGPYSLLCLCRSVGGWAEENRLAGLLSAVPELDKLRPQVFLLQSLLAGCSAPPLPPLIERAERRLRQSPEAELRVGDLARAAYMSESHFIRSFHKAVGLTPHRFQIQNRVRKAQRLLEGGTSAAEAALAAGFCDQSHLTRHFRRLLGLTPAAYGSAALLR